jgi:putative PIN family toxin of toxin-antitoxin system
MLECTSRTPARVLAELHLLTEIVIAPPLPVPVCRDPDDDAVLACAVAAQVDAIISGDSDLLALKQFQGIPILTSAEALQQLTAVLSG